MLLKGRDAQQNHGVSCSWAGAFFSNSPLASVIVHDYERTERQSMSAGLLRQQNLLRNVTSAHRGAGAAVRQIWR